jgi:serine/threonine protein phosphatase PrpC
VTLSMRHAGLSDIGRARAENQDRWIADPEQGLFVVADGMGGRLAGELASQVVVETLPGLLRKRVGDTSELSSAVAVARVTGAIAELSARLESECRGKPGLAGLGATVVMALVRGGQALIGHLGDSRAYLLRGRELRRLTKDHSIVQLLIDTNEIDPADAASHPARGQLTRFVGMEGEPLPEVQAVTHEARDRLLLCSDGLTGQLSDAAVGEILLRNEEPPAACRELIDAANEAGGKDNITALVVEFGEIISHG